MKVKYNEKEILSLNETKRKVLLNDLPEEGFDADIERRLVWVLTHKHEQCMKRLRDEWLPKLKANGVQEAPLDDDAFAELVFRQPNYKNRSQRENESSS